MTKIDELIQQEDGNPRFAWDLRYAWRKLTVTQRQSCAWWLVRHGGLSQALWQDFINNTRSRLLKIFSVSRTKRSQWSQTHLQLDTYGEGRIFELYMKHRSVRKLLANLPAILGTISTAPFYSWLKADEGRWAAWQEVKAIIASDQGRPVSRPNTQKQR
ncbi:hypothetical protein CMI37_12635 [Candidatus Pacearchaeota archaeon]|nr:hypothetical protein [Candidatus Pacearchaeota archaeon]